jgi:hypothetical protein
VQPKKEAAEKAGEAAPAGPAENGSAQAPPEESWRTSDPYAFFPKPNQNNQVGLVPPETLNREPKSF